MLDCGLDVPDPDLGEYVAEFLQSAPWIRRRVETVGFVDVDTVVRRVTVDVGMREVSAATAGCPIFPDRPIVPLTMLAKELLVGFDLRRGDGSALAVLPREVDSFMAWSALANRANDVLGGYVAADHPEVASHLRSLTWRFPENGDDIDAAEPSSWRRHDFQWSAADEDVWERLLADPQFDRLLRDFTFGFILCTQLPGSEFLEVVKFAYKQTLPYAVLRRESAGLVPVELNVDAPAVGQLRSYHLRVEGPPGLHLTDVALFRTFEEADEPRLESVLSGQAGDPPSPRSNADSQAASDPPEGAESSETIAYQRRLTPEWAQIYTTPAAPAGFVYKVAVHLRVPLAGFLRSAWMASVFVFGVLVVGRVALADVQSRLTERSEAAIALLLVGPSLLSAYVVRPDEHAITSRLLRSVRYAVAASGLAGYVAAGSLLIAERTTDLGVLWTVLVGLAGAVAGYVTIVVATTWWNIRTAGKQSGSTNTSEIIDVYFTK